MITYSRRARLLTGSDRGITARTGSQGYQRQQKEPIGLIGLVVCWVLPMWAAVGLLWLCVLELAR